MKILLAYDGSTAVHAAIQSLAKSGIPKSGQMIVLTAAEDEQPGGGGLLCSSTLLTVAAQSSRRADSCHRFLAEQAAKSLRRILPEWQIGTEFCEDAPQQAILEKALAWNAELIVLGANGHSTSGRNILGSVALRVLCESRCCVRIGRHGFAGESAPRLMIGMDGSAGAEAAVRAVAARQWPEGTHALIVSVLEDSAEPTQPIWLTGKQAARILETAGLTVENRICSGEAGQILVREASNFRAHCLFVGATGCGRGRLSEIGDVAYAVAARAPCTVEIVRDRSVNPASAPRPR